ncbi:MAG: hypothetical protein Q7K34_00860, partial [archaeon]|nr:hypothetical protein [archaeon]
MAAEKKTVKKHVESQASAAKGAHSADSGRGPKPVSGKKIEVSNDKKEMQVHEKKVNAKFEGEKSAEQKKAGKLKEKIKG